MPILGLDEVGRGPLAGPLVIGAAILDDPTAEWCEKLTDSKKLTPKKRQLYATEILEKAPATALGWVSSQELDQIGMSQALRLATRRAVTEIQRQKVPFHEIIIDGTVNFLSGTQLAPYVTTLKKADLLIKEVSAASIIAKVARDTYMTNLAELYPGYGFEKHMGYGTAAHLRALRAQGPCPEHRRSFRPVAELYHDANNQNPAKLSQPSPEIYHQTHNSRKAKNTTATGTRAETAVAEYLVQHGHQLLTRNHKTKFYEIDLITIKDEKLYFTEVKYRKTKSRGAPLEAITPKKQQQMRFAAEAFLKFQPHLKIYQPQLAAAAVSGSDFTVEQWLPIS